MHVPAPHFVRPAEGSLDLVRIESAGAEERRGAAGELARNSLLLAAAEKERLQRANDVRDPLVGERETLDLAMAEGFEYVAMARALLREPDLVNRMRDGRTTAGICIHCNRCMPTIYSGTRCPEWRAGEEIPVGQPLPQN